MAEYKCWQRRESRNNIKLSKNQKSLPTNIVEAIAQLSSGDSSHSRMKILVKKEDLKQVMEAIRDRRGSLPRRGPPAAATSLEQRLHLLRRRQILRVKAKTRFGSWRPVLQSIPEEELST